MDSARGTAPPLRSIRVDGTGTTKVPISIPSAAIEYRYDNIPVHDSFGSHTDRLP